MKITASTALLDRLANEDRLAFADWRALVLLRRATREIPAEGRRWSRLPNCAADLSPLLRQMRGRGEVDPFTKLPGVYKVTVPYAKLGFVDEHEILFEANPYAVLSHFTALVFHGMTEEFPKRLFATIPSEVDNAHLPIGTTRVDWDGLDRPFSRKPATVLDQPVTWSRIQALHFFGYDEHRPYRYPIRVTNRERTLIDALQAPGLCGGVGNVLKAWVLSRDEINLDVLVDLVNRLDIGVLRQRVGFILESLQLTHPALDVWRARAHRGGSSRLVGSRPFASSFDERWNRSLNASVDVLRTEAA